MTDMTQLRAELRSPDNDADDRERILLAAMKNVLLYHCKLGTWRGESIAAIDILHGAGFTRDEVIEYHADAIKLIEADGIVAELMGNIVVGALGLAAWLAWWFVLPSGMV